MLYHFSFYPFVHTAKYTETEEYMVHRKRQREHKKRCTYFNYPYLSTCSPLFLLNMLRTCREAQPSEQKYRGPAP